MRVLGRGEATTGEKTRHTGELGVDEDAGGECECEGNELGVCGVEGNVVLRGRVEADEDEAGDVVACCCEGCVEKVGGGDEDGKGGEEGEDEDDHGCT